MRSDCKILSKSDSCKSNFPSQKSVIFPLPTVSKLASSRPGELAPSELVAGDPASSRDAELATCELAICKLVALSIQWTTFS
ncbi:UNVERIFIED_CONTAM: hypothetical protein Slati_2968600 [Sesamum latifolium]|uniref:Uncharacterized protein n=1 Tax=Sesamum latifolium TaxID=2727402 RepID=A0AAW2VFL9_9LAMI